jgi:hypothetical protein
MSAIPKQQEDFQDFDLALFKLPGPPWHTLFPTDWTPLFPDPVVPTQQAEMASIHYPGDPGNNLREELCESRKKKKRIFNILIRWS